MSDGKKKKKKKKSYSHLSGKPYNYKEHGWLSNLEMGSIKDTKKSFQDTYNYTKRLIKKSIKDAVKKNLPEGAPFSERVKKWNKGGKVHFRNNPQHN